MSKSQPVRIARTGVLVASLALIVAACGSTSSSPGNTAPITGSNFNPTWLSANNNAGTPKLGGTLRIMGTGDVDHLDTAAAYYAVTYTLERTFSRTLYNYPASTNIDQSNTLVPDVATTLPAITDGGKTYTITIRPDVMWNTTPPRAVTSQDFARGFARLCNPASPVGAPGYYTQTIVGMKDYCDAFGSVNSDAPSIKSFMASHSISGITTPDSKTIVFKLLQPASDFLNIISLPFGAAAPVEYLNYVPDSSELHANLRSDGPYAITKYVPNTEIDLARNTSWSQSTDPIRHQYVDNMVVTEGPSDTAVQQALEAGTADLEWDTVVPTADLGRLQGPPWDNRLGIFPQPGTNPYLVFNLQSTTGGSAIQNVKVRQALEYAIDKVAMGKIYGGAALNQPLNQVIPPGQVGYQEFNLYPTTNNQGDPAKCKTMLAAAGVTNLKITDVYRNSGKHPDIFTEVQKDFGLCGVTVAGVQSTGGDFYAKYLDNPTASKANVWDIAEPGWIPDWYGNNGRSITEPLFDGRTYGPNSSDFGDYNNATVNALIDKALQATSEADAAGFWHQADVQIMTDAAIIPFQSQYVPIFRSARVHNAIYQPLSTQYDLTQVWLS